MTADYRTTDQPQRWSREVVEESQNPGLRKFIDESLHDYLTDGADLMVRAYTWLSGDFDPRTLRRRAGWALRRYRGEHRDQAWSVTDLADQVARHAEQTRRYHLASLRRRP